MSRARRPFRLDPRHRVLLRRGLLAAALLVLAAPAWGYIVIFKDGSTIQTKEKYRIEGDMAYLVLPSGTEASYRASEIDVEKTEEVNVVEYGGTTKLIEGYGKAKQLPKGVRFEGEEDDFGQYISGRNLALPEVRKRQAATSDDELPITRAGFVDLMALRRAQYPSTEITGEVLGYLKGQGVDRVRIFQGTQVDRPLLEIVAVSEASVFKAIKDAASGLVQIHEQFPELVTAFELVLMTDAQERAGQFVMTPELAELLVTEKLTVPQFFLRFVEF